MPTDVLSSFDHAVVAENFPVQQEMLIAVYSRYKNTSKV
jgi:hypothetical protein